MVNDNLEQKLESIKLVNPTSHYVEKGNELLSNAKGRKKSFYWNIALAASLFISLGINVMFLTGFSEKRPDTTMKNAQISESSYSIEYGATLPRTKNINETLVWEKRQ